MLSRPNSIQAGLIVLGPDVSKKSLAYPDSKPEIFFRLDLGRDVA